MPDLVISAANVVPRGGRTSRGFAGVAVVAGQMVALDPSDNRFKLADCDATDANLRTPAGMAVNSAAPGQELIVQIDGEVAVGAGVLVLGTAYYLSPNPGGIAPRTDILAGDWPVIVGIPFSTSILRLGILPAGSVLP
jgi:hypothetical protein